jgi:GT2 family glycosyltransferase
MPRDHQSQAPELSITTVLFNSAATVDRYAEPLEQLARSGFAELIAIDNASPDDSAERLKARLPDAEVVTAPRNLGFAGGCNLACPHVRGRYWMLLNPDVEANAQGIRDLVRWMDVHPEVAIASPMLTDESGAPASVGRAFPTIRWTLAEMLRLHKLANPSIRSRRLGGSYWDGRPGPVDWVPFTAVLIRRQALEGQPGPLSDELFMYGEDVELCWRLRHAGWQVAISGDATFEHAEGVSAAATWDEPERARHLVTGIAGALRLIRGRTWTRLYAAVAALTQYVANIGPRRESARRANSLIAREWLRQAVGSVPAGDEADANLPSSGAQ